MPHVLEPADGLAFAGMEAPTRRRPERSGSRPLADARGNVDSPMQCRAGTRRLSMYAAGDATVWTCVLTPRCCMCTTDCANTDATYR